jgi:hypothetical protein
MSGAAKFALGIVFLWVAMVAFYFAFHPNGVEGVTNPTTALQWLIKEFQQATGQGSVQASAGAIGSSDVGVSPTPSGTLPTNSLLTGA